MEKDFLNKILFDGDDKGFVLSDGSCEIILERVEEPEMDDVSKARLNFCQAYTCLLDVEETDISVLEENGCRFEVVGYRGVGVCFVYSYENGTACVTPYVQVFDAERVPDTYPVGAFSDLDDVVPNLFMQLDSCQTLNMQALKSLLNQVKSEADIQKLYVDSFDEDLKSAERVRSLQACIKMGVAFCVSLTLVELLSEQEIDHFIKMLMVGPPMVVLYFLIEVLDSKLGSQDGESDSDE